MENREKLKNCLKADFARTELENRSSRIRGFICREPYYVIWLYIRALRKEEYHTSQNGLYHKAMHYFWRRRRNRLGEKNSLFLEPFVFQEGLMIWHPGVVVNYKARVGKNCTFHGQNCIGNDGHSDAAPVLGDNVTLGVGASVIGDVHLADGITVGAGAVVLHSFDEPGISIGGIPARKLQSKEKTGAYNLEADV